MSTLSRNRGASLWIEFWPKDGGFIMLCFLLSAIFLSKVSLTSGSDVRLVGGKHAYEGKVEIFHDGEWRAICDHGWNFKAANVVCRMLGFPDALRYTIG